MNPSSITTGRIIDCRYPELLAPAGSPECIRAAIENGADAVYFGLDCGFNARARAVNFPINQLADTMSDLHRRGVKGYVTLNTLIFSDELPELEQLARVIASTGVDAVLVQDLGVARLLRAICPELPLHASTQMTLTSTECIEVAKELGICRVVLPRELSIDEIREIHATTSIELEAFVHGALCVAYSGQCLTSESLGGRSANRGQCAQACRLPYDVICDGKDVDLGEQKYLLSPQDLSAIEFTPDLISAGIRSFKIEGRLKTPEYVANITRHYRSAIDTAMSGQAVRLSPTDRREMELSFSRGFSPGWLEGCDHKRLVPGFSSAKRGVFLGKVVGLRRNSVTVELASPVSKGDGVVFEGDRLTQSEQGGRVYHIRLRRLLVEGQVSSGVVDLEFGRDAINFDQLWVGQELWKTDDPQLNLRLRKTFTGADPLRRRPVDLDVRAVVGEPLKITARLIGEEYSRSGGRADFATVTLSSEQPLEAARKHPLTGEVLREQLSRLGASPFELGELHSEISGNPMAPLSVLSKLRQTLIEELLRLSGTPRPRRMATGDVLSTLRQSLPLRDSPGEAPVRLTVLCRSLKQLETALSIGERDLLADFNDIRDYPEAVTQARQRQARLLIATPRIQKPGEIGIFRVMAKSQPDGFLVRNLAGMEFCSESEIPFVADYSMNITNELTAQFLMDRGASWLTASYDLNRDQLLHLVESVPPQWLEVVIHQHMPMFHMEHCVYCAVLSPGTNKTNCGRPCDRLDVKLRDRVGMEHPLAADVGCRNTLFNATPQSSAEVVPELVLRGIRQLRIEFLNESPSEMRQVMESYRDLITGRISGQTVWATLKAMNRVGVTRGTLEERRNPLAIL